MTTDQTGADPRLPDPELAALLQDSAARSFWAAVTQGRVAADPALERQLAREILALQGDYPAQTVARCYGSLLQRAGSALRARARDGLSPANGPEAALVEIAQAQQPFRGYFAVDQIDLQHRRFDGTLSAPLRREVFVSGDAVTVLPYDPLRDRLLLVEQFRPGPLARGEQRPWLIEAVAGRIDPGESPEQAARREAAEEAGLSLTSLLPVAEYYPSPGVMSEYLWSYLALTDLPDLQGGVFGLAAEGEDIRSHIVSFDQAMAWQRAGRLANAPLILTLFWLAAERARLRADFAQA
ncbi:NUDIX domain-containing protein [Pseudogemmobacter faecipullorum]|uniref:ADP-ribose pyrophosphatase n=1 Tax=Pseudogemmobacter faecipullorum TaxID=2755041 RepID=A0ABS8CLH7_9RHOB|nr:NUDIX domain-containing protein [Pseudogemmobacter faecipullorum]MCB5410254.1 NUDIX domain-containing protein [Pseudogemmobacter faecipullorum]